MRLETIWPRPVFCEGQRFQAAQFSPETGALRRGKGALLQHRRSRWEREKAPSQASAGFEPLPCAGDLLTSLHLLLSQRGGGGRTYCMMLHGIAWRMRGFLEVPECRGRSPALDFSLAADLRSKRVLGSVRTSFGFCKDFGSRPAAHGIAR